MAPAATSFFGILGVIAAGRQVHVDLADAARHLETLGQHRLVARAHADFGGLVVQDLEVVCRWSGLPNEIPFPGR